MTPAYSHYPADNLIRTPGGGQQAFDVSNQLCWTNPTANPAASCIASSPATATRYVYDNRGNRTTKAPPGGPGSSYGYDQANRLVTAATPDTSSSEGQYKLLGTPGPHHGHRSGAPVAAGQNGNLQVTVAGGVPSNGCRLGGRQRDRCRRRVSHRLPLRHGRSQHFQRQLDTRSPAPTQNCPTATSTTLPPSPPANPSPSRSADKAACPSTAPKPSR